MEESEKEGLYERIRDHPRSKPIETPNKGIEV